MEKKEMQKPELLGVEAAACVANPAAAIAVFGTQTGNAIVAAGVVCNLPAMVPLLGAGSIIA